jgi:glycosyltransferase involved in cell wall biosynthesis
MDQASEPLISVIVPVYKVEPYIARCVDSILSQTYTNLEIILVDDGSPDNCGAICDEYMRKDDRVTVIHKENGGLSDARNVGLTTMNGEFMTFVDSDDWLPTESIECLLRLIQAYGAQLAIGSSDRQDDNGNSVPSVDNVYRGTAVLNKKEAMADMLQHGCSAWARLYHRSIHEGILYPKGEINEDEAIVLRILDRCERVVVTEQVVYHYRCRVNSITTNAFSKEKLIWHDHCAKNLRWIREHQPELTEIGTMRYRDSLLWSISEIAKLDDDEPFRDDRNMIVDVLRKNRDVFDRLSFETRREKLRYQVLMQFGYRAYRLLLRIKRKIAV